MLPYAIDPASGIVEILGVESPDVHELEATIVAVLADPSYRRGYGFLRDRRGADPPSTSFITGAIAVIDRVPELAGSRWAVVVSDAASYGMIRMASMLTQGTEIQVFDARHEAVAWLTGGGGGHPNAHPPA